MRSARGCCGSTTASITQSSNAMGPMTALRGAKRSPEGNSNVCKARPVRPPSSTRVLSGDSRYCRTFSHMSVGPTRWTRAGRRPASDDVARALLRSPLWPLRPVVSCRHAFRPDRPLRALAQLPRDRDRFAGQHQPRRVEQDFVLCGAVIRRRARGSIPANALDGLAVDAAPLDHSRAVIRTMSPAVQLAIPELTCAIEPIEREEPSAFTLDRHELNDLVAHWFAPSRSGRYHGREYPATRRADG